MTRKEYTYAIQSLYYKGKKHTPRTTTTTKSFKKKIFFVFLHNFYYDYAKVIPIDR